MALWAGGEVYYPDRHLEQREQIAREIQRVGEEYDLPVFQVLGHVVAVYSLNVRLEWADARWHAEQAGLLARKFQLRQGIFISNVLLAMIEHATGDPEKAAHAYQDAFEAQRSVGSVDADAALLLALTTVRASQGRLAELIGDLRLAYRELLPAIGHLLAFALAESGQPEEARRVLAEVPPLVEDYIWPVLACMRARTLATLGITEGAAELYRALLPYTGQVAGAGTTGFVLMPIDGAAGHLAVLLGRPQDALSHFEQALVVAEKCGSPSWIELARADLVSVGSLQRN
jgi:tetratricopeptide (TPR) repeat protein